MRVKPNMLVPTVNAPFAGDNVRATGIDRAGNICLASHRSRHQGGPGATPQQSATKRTRRAQTSNDGARCLRRRLFAPILLNDTCSGSVFPQQLRLDSEKQLALEEESSSKIHQLSVQVSARRVALGRCL